MTQTRGRIFDDLARLATDAAGMAEGVKREAETLFRTQAERLLSTMDVVTHLVRSLAVAPAPLGAK